MLIWLPESTREDKMIGEDVQVGDGVIIFQPDLVNLYGCEIGTGSKIAAFVEIRQGVKIGRNVKIQPFTFIPEGITIEDGVFIGPHVCFTNDKYPRAVKPDGSLMGVNDWKIVPTLVKHSASIGASATIMCGITIGESAMVGAGAVVLHDVPAYAIVAGVPARVVGDVRDLLEEEIR